MASLSPGSPAGATSVPATSGQGSATMAGGVNVAVPSNLLDAALRIDVELSRRKKSPMILSTQAASALEIAHAEFLGDVGQEAVRIARRANLRTVDESHVKEAASRIGIGGSRNSALETSFNTLGGVIAGAGIASVYSVNFNPGPHSSLESITSVSLSVLGAVLLAIGLTVTVQKGKR